MATAEPAATPEPAASTARQAPAAEAPEVPLRSLTRYQQDPAFQNFVQKLKRPPGARERRRLNPDELERKR